MTKPAQRRTRPASAWPGVVGSTYSGPVPASALDAADLARRARTTVAAADEGTVVVAGTQLGELRAAVQDGDGEPAILLPSGLALPPAGRRGWPAALFLAPGSSDGVGVTLVGRMSRLPVDVATRSGPSPAPRDPFALAVERVAVSCPRSGRPGVLAARQPIPLDVYAAAEPDLVMAHGPRWAAHLNEAHAPLLRAQAARLAGHSVEALIGACISAIGARGLELRWVDAAGAHTSELGFARPATNLVELKRAIRAALGG